MGGWMKLILEYHQWHLGALKGVIREETATQNWQLDPTPSGMGYSRMFLSYAAKGVC